MKVIIQNEKGKAIIRRKGKHNWCVALFYLGELVAIRTHYFKTKKECVFEANYFLDTL